MSFHHPQDRHRDRKEQIQQQYHEARDKMSHLGQKAQTEEGQEESKRTESEEERKARFEFDIERRLDTAGKQIRRERERGSARQ